ncbi:hypothetical protein RJ639_045090 [Escallonia herrerae]|uniref:Extra-large guanine nucleotide-binding protein 1 n=1 Tax=Escallonia herrerae TaxID=1293975 RepID=A0AA88W8H3_9ASTE|nr:hypothetical protein RJ639_045090 [Escallonia herrerae]
MTSLLRSILPIRPPKLDVEDEYDVEYSFAMEYTGPAVSYDIPRAVPVNVDRIPTAAMAATPSMLDHLSLPVIQPIVKSNSLGNKSAKGSKLGLEALDCSTAGVLPCKSLDEMHRPSALGLLDEDELTPRVLDKIGSSGTLGFSDSRDVSHELSGSSDEGLHDDCKEDVSLDNYQNPVSWHSPAPSSEDSSDGEDCDEEVHYHDNRTSTVTFCRPESNEIIVIAETDPDEPIAIQGSQMAKLNVKKGLCHRCLKGNRFTEKEVCIVCNAKYCINCVLRAMGSMPEGRKCIACIGSRIDESSRRSLGNCSRLLKRLLTDPEVKHIMNSEVSSEANQIPPVLVCVNGKPLCAEELGILQGCPYPPKKLKPGKYWYDRVSGLWGKEGQKPSQIISPQLAVGDPIMRNASNGNTKILINRREITKSELWMLQIAGIRCEGCPHFWLSADGSCQEEGQKNVLGRIWEKTGIKLVCAGLSLPVPPESMNSHGGEVVNVPDEVGTNHFEQKILEKFLLVGYDQSGTDTIFKQAKFMYNGPFSEDERHGVKFMIQSSLYRYLGILLEGRQQFEEECFAEMRRKQRDQPGPSGYSDQIGEETIYSISPRLKPFCDWLLQVMTSGNLEAIFPAATREYAPLVEELWKDKAFQATYSRRMELDTLPIVANRFLDRAVEISRTNYEPSDLDILSAEGITSSNGLACVEFSFPESTRDSFMDSADQNDPLPRHQLIRVHTSSLGKNCKWLEMFEDVGVVLYCVALTDYDQFSTDINGVRTNKLSASKKLFESIVTHPTFDKKDFLLVLTKFDLLEEKIERVPLTQCDWFHDFNPVVSVHPSSSITNYTNPSLAQRAFHYVAVKFKTMFHSLTGHKLYVSPVSELNAVSVDAALRYGREIIKWDHEKPCIIVNELSSGSLEASNTSSFL